MISANNVTLRIGKKALFEDVNIKFTEGNCYGLIGANGAGKSTFLKILSGQLDTTNGNIVITPGQRLSVLEQDHFKYDAFTVMDTVIMGNQRLYDIMKEKDAIYAKEDFSEEDGYEDEDITELEDEDFFTDQYEETIKPSRSSGKKSESRKARKGELEEEDMEQLLYTVEPKRKERDIIPREKKMTSEEEKLFTYFAKVPGLREQIVDALYDAQICASDKTSRTGNIIVMGGRETGKTRLISGLIPAICKQLNLEASKVAYVFADQINGKNIADIVRKMSGGFLVIENANQLTKETVNQLNKAMEFRTDGLIVIIEDEKIGMRKLIARFPKFTSKFTSMINIPVFTNDELVNFAKIYTRENGYTIDQMAMLSLYNLISTNQKEDQPMNIGAVKDIIDGAISKSRGGLRKLISKKKVNQDGYLVLYEKDFN